MDWQATVNDYGPLVWRTVHRLLRNEADAEECFQETFMEAVKVARRRPIDNVPAFLVKIATFRAIDQMRNQNLVTLPQIRVPHERYLYRCVMILLYGDYDSDFG